MSFDLTAHFGTMTRVVEDVEQDGKPAKAVIASRHFDTDPDDLWNALTDPERLPRWFMPISGDLKIGGRYQLHGNAGGVITACEPPESLAVTWEMRGDVSWVTVRLEAEAGGTRLTLRHVAYPPKDFWPVYGPGAVGVGWDQGFMGLARHIADPDQPPPTPDEVAHWHEAEDARAFIRAASDDWGRAAIASGTSKDEALAAAERTRAFYTGDPPPGA